MNGIKFSKGQFFPPQGFGSTRPTLRPDFGQHPNPLPNPVFDQKGEKKMEIGCDMVISN